MSGKTVILAINERGDLSQLHDTTRKTDRYDIYSKLVAPRIPPHDMAQKAGNCQESYL